MEVSSSQTSLSSRFEEGLFAQAVGNVSPLVTIRLGRIGLKRGYSRKRFETVQNLLAHEHLCNRVGRGVIRASGLKRGKSGTSNFLRQFVGRGVIRASGLKRLQERLPL